MAISFVGSGTGTHNATGGATYNFSSLLNASGGTPTLQENDLVLVITSIAGTTNLADGTMTPTTPSGYQGVYTPNLGANDSHDSNLQVSWKFMESSPDTSVGIRGVPATTNSCAYLVFVLRGVSTSDPFDVTPTSASSNNSGTPNAPAITPSTPGSWILCFGGSAMATGTAPSSTPPTGMDSTTNHFRIASLFTQTNDAAVAGGIKSDWTAGAYDPAAFGGFNTTNTGSWTAASIALRPASLNNYSLTADQATVSASGIANRTLYARRMLADVQSIAITTVNTTLTKGRVLTADAQTFAITTVTAGTKYGRSFPAALATINLTGPPNRLLRSSFIRATAVSYSVGSTNTSLRPGKVLFATSSSTSTTALSAILKADRRTSITSYSTTVSALSARVLKGYTLATTASSYVVNSFNVVFGYERSFVIAADPASVAIAGIDIGGRGLVFRLITTPSTIQIRKASRRLFQFEIEASSANMVKA